MIPRTIDNNYRGQKLALWLFGLVVLMKVVMSVNSIFNGPSVITGADGIPLDSYPPAAARTVVALFALLGLSNFIICVVCIVALVRFRSAIPFLFALLVLEHLSRKLILELLPIARTGTPPGSTINLIVLGLMIVGLALSLWRRGASSDVSR